MMGEIGKELLTIVEIDHKRCANEYGVAPCTASGPSKCYKALRGCQDRPNFIEGDPLTIRYAVNQSGLPKTGTVFPALVKAPDASPGELNLSGFDPRSTALGKRDRRTVALKDFAYHDTLTDPYPETRAPGIEDRGTFFSRMFARDPYYVGYLARIRDGYVGQDFGDMATSHFVVSEASGPNAAGDVEYVFKDILDLADNAKALCPAASRGKASAEITEDDTSLTLIPETVGDEYPASGYVCIGREIMGFTRSGDVLTFTERGAWSTTAIAHAINDLVQVCAWWIDERPCDVINDILTDGGAVGIGGANVPGAFIPLGDWRAENDAWLAGLTLTSIIPRPTGCASLIGEVCQHGVMVFWEPTEQELQYRVNRPLAPGESYYPVTDAANLIRGSLDIERGDSLRASQVEFWHGIIDPTDFSNDGRNFKKAVIAVNENDYGQEQVKSIYSRWFGTNGDDAAASVIAERLADRYKDTPKIISGMLDVKDADSVALASLLSVYSYLLTDDDGNKVPELMQVRYVSRRNDQVEFKAETYSIAGRFAFILDDPTPDYDFASDDDKTFGAYIMDDTIGVFPDGTGPYVLF